LGDSLSYTQVGILFAVKPC